MQLRESLSDNVTVSHSSNEDLERLPDAPQRRGQLQISCAHQSHYVIIFMRFLCCLSCCERILFLIVLLILQLRRVESSTSSYSMAGMNVQIPTTDQVEGNVKQCEASGDANRPQVRIESAAASSSSSSSSSSQPGLSRRASTRRPDGTSGETGPSDLQSLETVLRRESIVDVIEVAHLTIPSTPLRDSVDGGSNDVRINLELASEKLSKLAPTD